ncbi:PLP-dependent aminotransferase family protein [Desulfonema ishimotonii]|uniref:PLP-dependent aminotransferase family protein n=2 Tax=Desulfonema ishimotonii TaxID=45657 RepID=A0A401FTQ3_9BACT|nr:PLP-dependent aminotransferase family protein [Desulfonema ishimotonii]
MKFENLLADRTENMRSNAIREILKVVSQPGMISLAGGIPAQESFPMNIMNTLAESVTAQYGAAAFQYDMTEGFMPLREALSAYVKARGISATAEEIIVTSGSQGVLDALGKVLISKGDRIAVEAPTYLGAISAFNPYEPEYVRMDTDDDGLIPESLEAVLRAGGVKFVYLVPTFQNPTGRTLPLERRQEIARILEKYDALLVEDDPYSALRYRGTALPPVKIFAPDHVVYVSTLSKVFAPGLRVGFCVAPELIRKWLVLVKQGTDLHTSTFNQALAAEYLSGGHLDHHLPDICKLYRPRQEAMLDALEKYFPDGFKWSAPEGGMFLWVEGPKGMDMEPVYWEAVARKAAFVPGKFFYTDVREGIETMRLNYTMADAATIDRAVRILGEVVAESA